MLEALDLAAIRGDRLLFSRLALRLEPGQMLRIAGANGLGKTTLLRMLVGLVQPETGDIRWQGQPIAAQRDAYHGALLHLGHAPAIDALLTPLENLRFACAAAGDRIAPGAAGEALVRIGLADQRDLPAGVLSAGQKRRIALARLFLSAHRPLWVLDEPLTALDAAAAAQLAATLEAHCAGGGMVVLTTHQEAAFGRPPRQFRLEDFAC